MLVSSAKSKGCVNVEALGRSLMYSMKNKGYKMEPWGTPHFIVYFVEQATLNCTNC